MCRSLVRFALSSGKMPMHSRILPIYKRCQWRENIIVLSQFGVAWSRFLCYITRVICPNILLSTHADWYVWIYRLLFVCVCVCLFVCTVTDFSAEDEVSNVEFSTVVHRRLGQGISHFGELCFPRNSAEARYRTNRPVYICMCVILHGW